MISGGLSGEQEGSQKGSAGFGDVVEVAAGNLAKNAMSAEEAEFSADECGAAFLLDGLGFVGKQKTT